MLDTIFNWAKEQLVTNQFAGGGLTVVLFSSMAYFLRAIPMQVWERVKRLVLLEVEIRQPDQIYDWMSLWLTQPQYTKRAQRLSATTKTDNEEGRLEVHLIPGIGKHVVRYGGQWLLISRERSEQGNTQSADSLSMLFERETYRITTVRWGRSAVYDFLSEVKTKALQREGNGPDIYLAQNWGYWERKHRMLFRPLSSVHLPDDLGPRLLGYCRSFQKAKNIYAERGLPWRLGIMLHGSPGNGKSSLIAALASELGLDIGYLNLADNKIGDNTVLNLFSEAGRRLIVIEDIDAIFNGRKKQEGGETLSFSGLLNAIDGVVSAEGHILVITTNHPEKLDPALVRPGRVDLTFEIIDPRPAELMGMYDRFAPDGLSPEMFLDAVGGKTMATAQQFLIEHTREVV